MRYNKLIVQDSKNIKLTVGILANEHSRRTSQNKALFKIGNQTFIEKLCDEFCVFDELLISATSKSSYANLPYTVVQDEHNEIGPIEGIRQILQNAKNEYVFICAADMPFLSKEIAMYLSAYISSDFDCYLFKDEDCVHTMCGIYSKRMLDVIDELVKQKKYCLLEIYDRIRTKYINYDNTKFNRKLLRNVNTKADYQKLNFPLIFGVCGKKNNGKTTLCEKLISHFQKTYTVSAIKHDAHGYIMDYPGKDS